MSSDDNSAMPLPVRQFTIELTPAAMQALEIIGDALAVRAGKIPNVTMRINFALETLAPIIHAAGGGPYLEMQVRSRTGRGRWVEVRLDI